MLENFIYAKNKSVFKKELEAGNILDEAIVFIADTKEIWNHGTYFDGSYIEDINQIRSLAYSALQKEDIDDLVDYEYLQNNYATIENVNQLLTSILNKQYVLENVLSADGVYIIDDKRHAYRIDEWESTKGVTGITIVKNLSALTLAIDEWYSNGDNPQYGNTISAWGGYDRNVTGIYNNTDDDAFYWSSSGSSGVASLDSFRNITDDYSELYTGLPAVEYCRQYKKGATEIGDWHLPSLEDLNLVSKNRFEVNRALTKVGGTSFSNSYWTIDQRSKYAAWVFSGTDYAFSDSKNKAHKVRPVSRTIVTNKTLKQEIDTIQDDLAYMESDYQAEVKVVKEDGTLVNIEDADDSCMAVALSIADLQIWIHKKSFSIMARELGLDEYHISWGLSGLIKNPYTTIDGSSDSAFLVPNSNLQYIKIPSNPTYIYPNYYNWSKLGAISDNEGFRPPADTTNLFGSIIRKYFGDSPYQDWIMPSCKLLALIYFNRKNINKALKKMNAYKAINSYVSSTEKTGSVVWGLDFYYGKLLAFNKSHIDDSFVIRYGNAPNKIIKERVFDVENKINDMSKYHEWSILDAPISTFTINDVTYQFDEGMTWRDWYRSDYSKNLVAAPPSDSPAWVLGELGLYEGEPDGLPYAYFWRNFTTGWGGDGYTICFIDESETTYTKYVAVNVDKPIIAGKAYVEEYSNDFTDL